MPLIELYCAGIPGIDMQCQRETLLFDMFQQQAADSLSALRTGYKQPCKVMLHHTGKSLYHDIELCVDFYFFIEPACQKYWCS